MDGSMWPLFKFDLPGIIPIAQQLSFSPIVPPADVMPVHPWLVC